MTRIVLEAPYDIDVTEIKSPRKDINKGDLDACGKGRANQHRHILINGTHVFTRQVERLDAGCFIYVTRKKRGILSVPPVFLHNIRV